MRRRDSLDWVAGATRDTLWAERWGLMPPSIGSLAKESSIFMPEGTQLSM